MVDIGRLGYTPHSVVVCVVEMVVVLVLVVAVMVIDGGRAW